MGTSRSCELRREDAIQRELTEWLERWMETERRRTRLRELDRLYALRLHRVQQSLRAVDFVSNVLESVCVILLFIGCTMLLFLTMTEYISFIFS